MRRIRTKGVALPASPERTRGPRGAKRRPSSLGRDEIVCRLCHRVYRAISVKHLRRVHDFRGEHPIEDYKRRFGLRVAWSRETCRRLRRVSIAKAKRQGTRWGRARITRELRRLNKQGRSLAPSRVDDRLYQAARRLLGSWSEALERAGIDPRDHRVLRPWDAVRVLAAVRARHADRLPLSAKQVKASDPGLYSAGATYIGSWSKTLRRAGLDPARHREPMKWSVAGARQWIKARLAAGMPILGVDVPRGMLNRVERDTGFRWPAFVESTGRRYPGSRRIAWTPELVLRTIRDRRRRGLPLAASRVNRERGTVTMQAAKYFGSWDAALRAAGVDPRQVRLVQRWTPNDVLECIRAHHARGGALVRPLVDREDSKLVRAAQRRLGTWERAVAAAGLAPTGARRR